MVGDRFPDVLQFKNNGCAKALIADEAVELLDEGVAHGLQGESEYRIMRHLRYRQMKIHNGGEVTRRKMRALLDALHQLLQFTDLQLACMRGGQLCRARLYCLAGFEQLVDCHSAG